MGESVFTERLWTSSSFISKVNTEPYPNSDRTKISPPNSLLIILQMHRPRPMPFLFRFLSLWILQNSLKRFFWSFLLMPSPLSWTAILMYCSTKLLLFLMILLTFILIFPPFGVYFKAFDKRLVAIYWSLILSVYIYN